MWQVEDGWVPRMPIGKASLCPGANDGGPDQAGVGDAEGGGGSEH